jgi:uridine kinase
MASKKENIMPLLIDGKQKTGKSTLINKLAKEIKQQEEVQAIENITFELSKKQRFIFDNWKQYCKKELEIKHLGV